jgi:hypothetical protein
VLQLGIELPPETQYRVEFKNPEDQHDDGQFPLSGQRMEIYTPLFPEIHIPFPLGPVVIWIRKFIGVFVLFGDCGGCPEAITSYGYTEVQILVKTPWRFS